MDAKDSHWQAIFRKYKIHKHDFEESHFVITAEQIKAATRNAEPRILCKQDTRKDRPTVFEELGLFILPIRNGTYVLIRGDGYVDIPEPSGPIAAYESKLKFLPLSSLVGDSEMQHLDFAYAASLIREITQDPELILTIRGRKYTPSEGFKLRAGIANREMEVFSVQTEVDAGYESSAQIVLVEAKRPSTNVIIRQLYYPYRQWLHYTGKPVRCMFFDQMADHNAERIYRIWEFGFHDVMNYDSIYCVRANTYRIT